MIAKKRMNKTFVINDGKDTLDKNRIKSNVLMDPLSYSEDKNTDSYINESTTNFVNGHFVKY
jgi:hypothetical protein